MKTAFGVAETQGAAQTTQALSPEYLTEQEAITAGMEEGERRIHRSVERAVAMGIIDRKGNLLAKALPADMLPGSDRDFGG
jgi:hypothetical protein